MLQSIKASMGSFLSRINLCGGAGNPAGNAHAPQRYSLGGRVIQEERLLSEGGYGYVWEGHDVASRQKFAIKKMIIQVPSARDWDRYGL